MKLVLQPSSSFITIGTVIICLNFKQNLRDYLSEFQIKSVKSIILFCKMGFATGQDWT